ncbi:MAG: hypothetical protein IT427_20960 [Pirellulales bacterium]|nr:hypothetical protein [Pirellulales bacterium]
MRWLVKPPVTLLAIFMALPLAQLGKTLAAQESTSSRNALDVQQIWDTVSRLWSEAAAYRTAQLDKSAYRSDASTAEAISAAGMARQVAIAKDGRPMTPELESLGEKVRQTLAIYEPKHLNARDHSSWEVMHGLIAYGPRTQIYRDGPGGQTVNAMGWLCWGAPCRGDVLIVLENGKPHARYGVGLQGHDGQYLAMLAQWKVRPESPMRIEGVDMSVADYIAEEKMSCKSGGELTFKLIALSHYLPSDAHWTSRNGEQWSIPKLLKYEIEAPIHSAPCGGTHRLFGISQAYKIRLKRGEPLDGEYARAHKYITDYQRYTLNSLQNPDGSFSTEWFKYKADRPGDVDRKLQTTGHIMEWLAWSLPDEQLRDPSVMKTVDFLSGIMLAEPDRSWSIGPWGHALHALLIYHDRLFNQAALPPVELAKRGAPLKTAVKPATTSSIPPEPSCDRCVDSLPANKMKPVAAAERKAGEKSDGCVDSVSEQSRSASTAALPDPIARPAPVTNLRR